MLYNTRIVTNCGESKLSLLQSAGSQGLLKVISLFYQELHHRREVGMKIWIPVRNQHLEDIPFIAVSKPVLQEQLFKVELGNFVIEVVTNEHDGFIIFITSIKSGLAFEKYVNEINCVPNEAFVTFYQGSEELYSLKLQKNPILDMWTVE